MYEIYFSNVQLEEEIQYFLYIGELKNYGLNTFLKEALSSIFSRKIELIRIPFQEQNQGKFTVVWCSSMCPNI
jgi:hypothetical protein